MGAAADASPRAAGDVATAARSCSTAPTRGYRRSSSRLIALLADRGIAAPIRRDHRHHRLAAGPRPRRPRPARSGRCRARGAADLHRRHRGVSQSAGRARRRAAGCRRVVDRRVSTRRWRALSRDRQARAFRLRHAELPEPDRRADVDGAPARRCSRPPRATICSILEDDPYGSLYFEDTTRSRRRGRSGRRPRGARRLSRQHLEDARARAAGRVDGRAAGRSRSASSSPSRRPICAAASSISASCTPPSSVASSASSRRRCARTISDKRDGDGDGAARDRWATDRAGRSRAAASFSGRNSAKASTTAALFDEAVAERVSFVVGSAFFVDGGGHRFAGCRSRTPTPDRIREGVARLKRALDNSMAMDR